jgi:hypothetical protein
MNMRRRLGFSVHSGNAPIFNVLCWFSVLIVGGSGALRLLSPGSPRSLRSRPMPLILVGLLFPLWHLHAACSPTTFLDLSRHGLRRSVCGCVSSWRWDQVASFKVRSRGPRSASWLTVEMWDDPTLLASRSGRSFGDDRRGVAAVRLDGPWTTFFFGGLDIGSLAERLNAWRAWATSEPMPSLEPDRHESFLLWVMLELWLGFLACLAFASFLAIGAPNGFANVIGASLLSFALASLLFVPLAAFRKELCRSRW